MLLLKGLGKLRHPLHKPLYRNMSQSAPKSMTTQFVDTHIHIDYILQKVNKTVPDLDSFIEENFAKMSEGRWEKSIHICCDQLSIEPSMMIIEHPSIYGALGIHPHNAKTYTDELDKQLIELHSNEKIIAWGEMGLDYHYTFSEPDVQKAVFERQIKNALQLKKPLVIHTREAEDDTYDIMTRVIPKDWPIHVHCFTSSLAFSQRLLAHFSNLYIGFTGVITFNNAADIREVVKSVPLERILLETDGPYLAPIPFRGKVATSGMIPKIAEKIAMIKEVDVEKVYEVARMNTKAVYGI